MFYHLIMQTNCNLSCSYCDREEFFPPEEEIYDYNTPPRIEYPLSSLKKQIKKEDYITFYGGEPLLALEKIKEIMDTIPCKGFMMQTNGTLLHKIPKEYLNRFHTILVSIDGDAESTNKNRGKGIQEKIMQNIHYIKEQGFTGELIARITITKGSSLYQQVQYLLNNGFTSIHWQLDAMFYEQSPYDWFEAYNKDITKLIEFWMGNIRQRKVIKLYPFIGITESLLKNEKVKLRCGAGFNNYTITTNGNIAPCPIMGSMKKYYVGKLEEEPKEITVKEPCTSCDILGLCGGRCLYVNLTQHGGEKAYTALCGTIRYLIKSLETHKKEIELFIKEERISLNDFYYLKYNGVEIIP
ncbi:TIGR04084 family radical SAM/SPASM domain-containing protein [Candidatus Woesearchaeota archaeon]|nr:TIGR04084 family radical SAM/SPASM domain-containing protein [Candidatus Woesearchaeota archaeon]